MGQCSVCGKENENLITTKNGKQVCATCKLNMVRDSKEHEKRLENIRKNCEKCGKPLNADGLCKDCDYFSDLGIIRVFEKIVLFICIFGSFIVFAIVNYFSTVTMAIVLTFIHLFCLFFAYVIIIALGKIVELLTDIANKQ